MGIGDRGLPSDMYLWIDGLVFYFKEVNAVQTDAASINRWTLRQAKFQDKNVDDWRQGHAIAGSILAALKDPEKSATIEPTFNPGIQLNDIFQVDLLGKKADMVVKRRKVTITGKTIRMKLEVGSKKPNIAGVVNAFRVVQESQGDGGSGYKLAETWADDSCHQLCESECEADCLITLDQTETKILSDLGVTRENPCKSACQTVVEL